MKKIYFFIPISVIITAIICFGISHLNTKKQNEQQKQTENTFFESMNAKVDKEKKAVYKMDGFDIQITDSVLGEGAFYCIAAVWCEDGYTGNLFDDEDGIVTREDKDISIRFGSERCSNNIISYQKDGITYLCCEYVYAEAVPRTNQYLALNISDNKGKKKSIPIGIAHPVYKKDIPIQNKDQNDQVYLQEDGSLVVYSNDMICHITAVGMYIQGDDELLTKFVQGKKQNTAIQKTVGPAENVYIRMKGAKKNVTAQSATYGNKTDGSSFYFWQSTTRIIPEQVAWIQIGDRKIEL